MEMPVYYMQHEPKQRTETMTSLEEIFRGATDNIAAVNHKINAGKQMECLFILSKE